jgi:hypothetical protein
MKQFVLMGILAMAIAAVDVAAQQTGERKPGQRVTGVPDKPSPQPATGEAPPAPAGDVALGTVRITRKVNADGKPLAPGTYQVRVTAQEAQPPAVGITEQLERWAEFVQRGQVKGREVVSIVPEGEIKGVAEDAPPRAGGNKVQMLKGNEYLRVWINKAGTHYLIHLATGLPESKSN